MKLPQFSYERPDTLLDAVEMLAADEDAKVLAGGQSLMPLMALRLARPSTIVDIAELGFDQITMIPSDDVRANSPIDHPRLLDNPSELVIGSLVRQRRIEFDEDVRKACPLLTDAIREVGYPATRNLGTIGGSLAHCDPTAELLAVAVALDGYVVAVGPLGKRRIGCADLCDGFFSNTLALGEIITEIHLPVASAVHGAAWCEWSPRAHDFAEAGVGVGVDLGPEGDCRRAFGAACAIGGRPLDLSETLVGAGVIGLSHPTRSLIASVTAAVETAASEAGEERAALTGLLAGRAVLRAFDRALTAGLGMTA